MTVEASWPAIIGSAQRLAILLATVDLERTLGNAGFRPDLSNRAIDDELLGARVVLVRDGPTTFAFAEPSTEGRLAGLLARHGEGQLGLYVAAPIALEELGRLAADHAVVLSRPASGPFGREVLVIDPGPQILLVEPRSVPSPR